MTIKDDIALGREQFRKKNQMRMRSVSTRRQQNKILVELGRIIEFVTSLIRKPGLQATSSDVVKTRRASPYLQIVRSDLNALLERLSDMVPKQKPKYDSLEASWKRGRFGSN